MDDTSQHHTPELGWGTPAQPTAPRPVRPTGWATLRRAVFWSVLVLGVPAIGLGLYAVAEDMADTTDAWHGFGIALGLLLAVPCLVLCLLAGFGLRSMRRNGSDGGRAHAIALGLLLLIVLMFVSMSPLLLIPVALGAFLLVSVFADQDGRP